MLVDATRMDLSTTLFGDKVGGPILISPMAAHQIAHPEGEAALTASEVGRLLKVLERPYDEQPEFEAYAGLPPDWAGSLQVSCSS